MNDELYQSLKEISHFIKEKFLAQKVILFGSYAYGNPTPDSDIDFFVIMDTDKRFPEEAANIRIGIDEEFHIAKPIDILVRTPGYVQKRLGMGDFFMKDIIEKGIEL
ncbi:MAG TPA: nucleotidyltransferase domain-containing protein [Spirochaetota bacterium]|nr:nucleotidyltransferase domain-containing protein [Spirochaetota bacterium]HOF13139.1 nucleotidyltransferase domain-containing protein [Spirochaetota bacterium]HOM87325.1 nucleotidyltransferase domain-containing protein [Spirochaetota bacterium]HOR92478.1 nucleotidyltransferase domain-containing protein [Spirochaetota bacterium]HOT18816.1 nucleotidyltransferase domain-containing protein [Spirochaetota bacterium]